jgi:hypothetical protein
MLFFIKKIKKYFKKDIIIAYSFVHLSLTKQNFIFKQKNSLY